MNIKKYIWIAMCLFCFIQGLHAHSIAFVHIGANFPSHLYKTVLQARLFNEECPIFLIAPQSAIQNIDRSFEDLRVTLIPCESLISSKAHIDFIMNPQQDWSFEGLWVYSSERFFYLEELIRQYNLSEVFHIESDVLLYTDLETFLPVFRRRYQGMLGAVFENDRRCVPSILYIADIMPIKALIDFYPKKVHVMQSDMDIIASFKDKYHQVFIDFLPITVPEYSKDYPLIGASIISKIPELYSNNVEEFGAIFDGAAFGIYLAGWNSRWHPNNGPGVISEYSVINPSLFTLNWEVDFKGRIVPFVFYKDKKIQIVNLHITNKSMIDQFLSVVNKN